VSRLTRWMDARLYPEYADDWDNKRFRQYVLQRLDRTSSILDFGAGRGALQEMNFKGCARFVAGVDTDPAVQENPFLDESRTLLQPDGTIPYQDDTFDLVLANNVLEHVQQPESCFRELYRVLKPRGVFVGKTPTFCITSEPSLASLRIGSTNSSMRNGGGAGRPRLQPRTNAPQRIAACATSSGFEVEHIDMWEGRPEYLTFSALTYLGGFLYERTVNRFKTFSTFRAVIVFTLRKAREDQDRAID